MRAQDLPGKLGGLFELRISDLIFLKGDLIFENQNEFAVNPAFYALWTLTALFSILKSRCGTQRLSRALFKSDHELFSVCCVVVTCDFNLVFEAVQIVLKAF